MDLTGDLLRGHTDAIILSILEQEDSYGYKINSQISKLSNNKFMLTEATLYTSFKRLENANYIISYWLEGENNKKRKYYSITETGKNYLKEHRDSWENVEAILNKILGGNHGKEN